MSDRKPDCDEPSDGSVVPLYSLNELLLFVDEFTVLVDVDGDELNVSEYFFSATESTSLVVDFIRAQHSLSKGLLSHTNQRTKPVLRFEAGKTYYFIQFEKSKAKMLLRRDRVFALASPSTISKQSLSATGVYQVISSMPLSFDLESHPLWTPDCSECPFREFAMNYNTEASHYKALVSCRPQFLRQLSEGNQAKASSIFPQHVFDLGGGYFRLPEKCLPEVIARPVSAGYPGFTAEAKKMDKSQVQELVTYGLMSIFESHFRENHEFYFSQPLLGIGLLSFGFIGVYSCVEVIGPGTFVSIISKPFLLNTKDHDQASSYVNSLAAEYGEKNILYIKQANSEITEITDQTYRPFKSKIFWKNLSLSNLRRKDGCEWTTTAVDGCFYKLVHLHHFSRTRVTVTASSSPSSSSPSVSSSAIRAESTESTSSSSSSLSPKWSRVVNDVFEIDPLSGRDYSRRVEELDAECWSLACAYSYHIYRVYSLYARCYTLPDRPEALVSARLLHGKCTALVECQFVGTRDAVEEDLNQNNINVLTDAIIWLAKQGLLYIDLRLPNIRFDINSGKIYLVDYDDLVILKQNLCCGYTVMKRLCNNEIGVERLNSFKDIAEALQSKMCQSCAKLSQSTSHGTSSGFSVEEADGKNIVEMTQRFRSVSLPKESFHEQQIPPKTF
jgi:hypothetical protein